MTEDMAHEDKGWPDSGRGEDYSSVVRGSK